MNFFHASPVEKLFNLLPLSHFTEFYYQDDMVMTCEKLFVLTDNKKSAHSPKTHAFISRDKHLINVSFMVEKVEKLQFAHFDRTHIARADNLWQDTCLELFIALSDGGYLEINASPDGRHAIYHFSDYRTPAIPVQTDDTTLQWRDDDNVNIHVYERHFSLDLSKFAHLIADETHINPCAVLNMGGSLSYFAVSHANPPDFHDKAFWQPWS